MVATKEPPGGARLGKTGKYSAAQGIFRSSGAVSSAGLGPEPRHGSNTSCSWSQATAAGRQHSAGIAGIEQPRTTLELAVVLKFLSGPKNSQPRS